MKAHRRSRSIAYFLFNLCARWGWVVNSKPWLLCPRERDSGINVWEAVWVTGTVWMDAGKISLTGLQTPNLP
jgi:hypothetical protein